MVSKIRNYICFGNCVVKHAVRMSVLASYVVRCSLPLHWVSSHHMRSIGDYEISRSTNSEKNKNKQWAVHAPFLHILTIHVYAALRLWATYFAHRVARWFCQAGPCVVMFCTINAKLAVKQQKANS